MPNELEKRILTVKNLSITRHFGKTSINVIKNFNLTVCKNEIVAIVGKNWSGKTSIAKAVSGSIPIVADQLTINEINVFEYYNSKIHQNRAIINKAKNVNYISKKTIAEFNLNMKPHSYYNHLIHNSKPNSFQLTKNQIELDFSYLTKLLHLKKFPKNIKLNDEIIVFENLKLSFYDLFSDNSYIKTNNLNCETHDNVRKIEKKYIIQLERILDDIMVYKSKFNQYISDYKIKNEVQFHELNEELHLSIIEYESKMHDKLKEQKKVYLENKKEVEKDFSDLHKSHLKERKDFAFKNFDEENKIIRNKYKAKIDENIKSINNLKIKYKSSQKNTKKIIKTKISKKFNEEIKKLKLDHSILLKEFIVERTKAIRYIKKNNKNKDEHNSPNTKKAFHKQLIEIQKILKDVKFNLIQMISEDAQLSPNYNSWKSIADRMILEWKKISLIPSHRNVNIKNLNNIISLGFLKTAGITDSELELKIKHLSILSKLRILIFKSLLLNRKLTIIDDIFNLVPEYQKNDFIRFLQRIKMVYGTSILMFSENLEFCKIVSDKISILHKGRVIESGSTSEILQNPEHPFTKALVEESKMTFENIFDGKNFMYFRQKNDPFKDTFNVELVQVADKNHMILQSIEKKKDASDKL